MLVVLMAGFGKFGLTETTSGTPPGTSTVDSVPTPESDASASSANQKP